MGGGAQMEGRAADGEQPAFTVSKMIQNDIFLFEGFFLRAKTV